MGFLTILSQFLGDRRSVHCICWRVCMVLGGGVELVQRVPIIVSCTPQVRPYLFDVLFHGRFPARKWVSRSAKKWK